MDPKCELNTVPNALVLGRAQLCLPEASTGGLRTQVSHDKTRKVRLDEREAPRRNPRKFEVDDDPLSPDPKRARGQTSISSFAVSPAQLAAFTRNFSPVPVHFRDTLQARQQQAPQAGM